MLQEKLMLQDREQHTSIEINATSREQHTNTHSNAASNSDALLLIIQEI